MKLIASILPVPIPIECLLIGLFMGMFPRKTATIFYLTTCGLLIVNILTSIPFLVATMQAAVNFGLAMESTPTSTTSVVDNYVNYLGALGVVMIVSVIVGLAKYEMRAIKVFFGVVLSVIFMLVYIDAPLGVFVFIVGRLSGIPLDRLVSDPILLVYGFVVLNIYIILTGPFIARWIFRRIGLYRRIPRIG